MELLGIDVLFKGSNMIRLLQGLWVSVEISLISVIISIVLGLLFGVFMTWKNPVAKVISRIYLEIVRIMPQLVLLFIVFFGFSSAFGVHISAELSASDMLEELDLPENLIESEATSVGGWVIELFGHIPEKGETVKSGIFGICVTEANEQSISKIRLTLDMPDEKSDE